MSVRMRVEIRDNHFPAVIQTIGLAGPEMPHSYAKNAQAAAKSFAPVRTGHLKASIQVARVGPLEYETYTDVNYARFNEWGTRYMNAQPFMAPGAQAALTTVPGIMATFGSKVEGAATTGRATS